MARMTQENFAGRVAEALGPRLVTLVLYGSAAREPSADPAAMNTLLIVTDDSDFLGPLATVMKDWTAAGHPPPIIMTEREWRQSANAFPIESEDIRDAHRILAGPGPWSGRTVLREPRRQQLEP